MKYEKEVIDEAKKKGLFQDKFDPDVLSLEDDEKKRMSEDFNRLKSEMEPAESMEERPFRMERRQNVTLNVELTFFERIIVFFLTLFGIQTTEQYKMQKVVRGIEKEISKIKPPIYSSTNKRVTKYFAFKIHDLYLKLVWLKQMFSDTLNNKALWDNPNIHKTILESLFENLAMINTDEIESKFSAQGIEMIISQFDDPKTALETIEKTLYSYIYSIDKSTIDRVNKIYTNLMYFKNLTEFDYIAFFRRFDPTYHPGVSPNFVDIPGDALLPYLKELEEAVLHIDLAIDNIFTFKKLYEISRQYMSKQQGDEQTIESVDELNETPPEMPEDNPERLGISPEKLETELIVLFEILKELLYKRYITLLIQIIKVDPLYTPSFVHTRYDLFKSYLETFERRIKTTAKKIIRDRKKRTISAYTRKLFSHVEWVGVYHIQLSDELENNGYLGFNYAFHIAVVNSFLRKYYVDPIRPAINVLILNGAFTEKNFHKLVSDTFYSMDKFNEKFEMFVEDVKSDGNSGKRLLNMLARKENYQNEHKNMVEKQIVSINGRARDLFQEFERLFSAMIDSIAKVYHDIDSKPPKYIRNIRGIGGFRNVKFLQTIEKSSQVLANLKEIMNLLKE